MVCLSLRPPLYVYNDLLKKDLSACLSGFLERKKHDIKTQRISNANSFCGGTTEHKIHSASLLSPNATSPLHTLNVGGGGPEYLRCDKSC